MKSLGCGRGRDIDVLYGVKARMRAGFGVGRKEGASVFSAEGRMTRR